MGDDNKIVRQRVSDQPVVSGLKKRRNRSRLIGLARGPGAHVGEGRHHRIIGRKKEGATARGCPIGEIVAPGLQFIAHLVDAGDAASCVLGDQPFPERRAEIEPVMQVLRLNEDVRVEQEAGQSIVPTSRPIF